MNLKPMIAAVLAASFTISGIASAQAPPPTREQNQASRINQGVRSGQLTRREARRLRRGQRRLARRTARAYATGMTRRKHRRLERAYNRQSRRIYNLKHNRAHRGM